jgi:hypothetical protein
MDKLRESIVSAIKIETLVDECFDTSAVEGQEKADDIIVAELEACYSQTNGILKLIHEVPPLPTSYSNHPIIVDAIDSDLKQLLFELSDINDSIDTLGLTSTN